MFARTLIRTQVSSLLSVISLRVAPLAILLITFLAWTTWDDLYPAQQLDKMAFKYIEEPPAESWQVADAVNRLRDAAVVGSVETRLSESWFWVMYERPNDKDTVVFPSRHIWRIQCWDGGRELGAADRSGVTGDIMPVLSGFAIMNAPATGICRVRHLGPAVLSIGVQDKSSMINAQGRYERHSGMLEGGMAMLALIALVVSVINQNKLFFLMSIWLVVGLRVAMLSFGSDVKWFGYAFPLDWLSSMRALTIALSINLTWLIARTILVKNEIKEMPWVYTALDVITMLVLAFAVILPYQYYLPTMWAALVVAVPLVSYLIIRRILKTDSGRVVLIWFWIALSIWLIASIYEVIAALFGLRTFIGTINHTVSALATSLLMLVAITIQAKHQRLALARSINVAQDEQSRMLARELHDSLGGTLTTLRLGVAVMKSESQREEEKKKLDHMVQLADEAIKTTRSVSHSLHPIMLETLGLSAALRTRMDCLCRISGIKGEIDFEEVDLPKDYQQTIYRVVQEGLSNVAKHSGASVVSIRGGMKGRRFLVEILDDGKGGASNKSDSIRTLGLRSMRERVEALGGELDIRSPEGKGTRISLSLPIIASDSGVVGTRLTYRTEE